MEGDHKKEKPKIVIVGAGLAGLTCAYRLFKSGIMCKVFEASERVGGRCFSIRNYFLDNQIAEHGGELIDSEHNEIKELAKEIGLKLENLIDIDKKENKPFYFFNGQPYSYDEAREIAEAIKNRKIVVVNTTAMETKVAQRLVDFISGACCVLGAQLQEVEQRVYLLSPSNVEVSNELRTEISSKALFNWNK